MGRLLAHRLAREEARLSLVDIDQRGLDALEREIRGANTYVCDVTHREEVAKLRAYVRDVDIVVNNAGVIAHGAYTEIDYQDERRMLAVNTLGVHWITKTFLPDLIASEEGHLVMMASVAAIVGVPYQALYSATKWFVAGLGESIRQEMRAEGKEHVHVTIVCPSLVATEFYDHPHAPFLVPILKPERVVERITTAIRRNRLYVREPFMVKLAPFLRGVIPARGTDAIARLLGIHRVVPRRPRP